MATGDLGVDEGTTKFLATYTFSEDAKTKNAGRSVLSDSAGAELKGQKAMAASVPVVLASDQASIPVNTGLSPQTDALTDAELRATAVPVSVSGVATAANQTTGNTSIANVDTNLGAKADTVASSDTGTFSLIALVKRIAQWLTSIAGYNQTVAGAVSASKMQVDVVSALPAGSNAIGKLAANSGVDIGDVDITSVPADPFGVNADAASATGSISAKLRFIASTGIPITGTVTVGSHAVTNAGVFVVQIDGAALTALQKIDDPILVDDAAFTPGTSSVSMAGFEADETATDSVDEGDAGAARMTLDRKQIVTLQPHATGGLSTYHLASAGSTNAAVVKNTPGQLYGYMISNTSAAYTYLVFHDASSTPTAGASVFFKIGIPAGGAANVSFPNGIAFATGIAITTVTGAADNSAAAVAANDQIINLWYK